MEIEITIQSAEVEDRMRKDGKGTFKTLNVLSDSGALFQGYKNYDTPELSPGDRARIIYRTGVTKEGEIFNRLYKIFKL